MEDGEHSGESVDWTGVAPVDEVGEGEGGLERHVVVGAFEGCADPVEKNLDSDLLEDEVDAFFVFCEVANDIKCLFLNSGVWMVKESSVMR